MTRRAARTGLAVLVAGLVLAGCGSGGSDAEQTTTQPPKETPSSGCSTSCSADEAAPNSTDPSSDVDETPTTVAASESSIIDEDVDLPDERYPASWHLTVDPGPCDEVEQVDAQDKRVGNCLSVSVSKLSDDYGGSTVSNTGDTTLDFNAGSTNVTYDFILADAGTGDCWNGSLFSDDGTSQWGDDFSLVLGTGTVPSTFDPNTALVAIVRRVGDTYDDSRPSELLGVWTATGEPSSDGAAQQAAEGDGCTETYN